MLLGEHHAEAGAFFGQELGADPRALGRRNLDALPISSARGPNLPEVTALSEGVDIRIKRPPEAPAWNGRAMVVGGRGRLRPR
jgi:hypothetical protein